MRCAAQNLLGKALPLADGWQLPAISSFCLLLSCKELPHLRDFGLFLDSSLSITPHIQLTNKCSLPALIQIQIQRFSSLPPLPSGSKSMALTWEWLCLPRDVWQCLQTFFIATTVGVPVASVNRGRRCHTMFYKAQDIPHNRAWASPKCQMFIWATLTSVGSMFQWPLSERSPMTALPCHPSLSSYCILHSVYHCVYYKCTLYLFII